MEQKQSNVILANIAKQTMNKIITTQKIPSGMEKAPYLELDNTAYTVNKVFEQEGYYAYI